MYDGSLLEYTIAIPRMMYCTSMLPAGVSGEWGESWGSGRAAGICEGTGLSEVVAADLASAEPRPDSSRMLSLLCCPGFHDAGVSKCLDIVVA